MVQWQFLNRIYGKAVEMNLPPVRPAIDVAIIWMSLNRHIGHDRCISNLNTWI